MILRIRYCKKIAVTGTENTVSRAIPMTENARNAADDITHAAAHLPTISCQRVIGRASSGYSVLREISSVIWRALAITAKIVENRPMAVNATSRTNTLNP